MVAVDPVLFALLRARRTPMGVQRTCRQAHKITPKKKRPHARVCLILPLIADPILPSSFLSKKLNAFAIRSWIFSDGGPSLSSLTCVRHKTKHASCQVHLRTAQNKARVVSRHVALCCAGLGKPSWRNGGTKQNMCHVRPGR